MQVDELRQARALAEESGRLKRIVADLTVQIDIFKPGYHKNMDFNSNVSNAKAIWTTLQLAQVNGGSMRRAVEAYKNGANTPEAVAGHFDEKSNWGSGDMMGEIFKVNFGYMLENDAGEGQAVHRFLYEMRVFTPPGSA